MLIQLTGHWKAEIWHKVLLHQQFCMAHCQVSILHNRRSRSHAPHCLIDSSSFGSLGACEQNRLQTSTAQPSAVPVCLPSPFPSWDAFPARPGLLQISECGLQEGLSLPRQKKHRRRGRKPSPLPHLAVFPKERLTLFFPFKKILVKGILVENKRQKLCSCACDQV